MEHDFSKIGPIVNVAMGSRALKPYFFEGAAQQQCRVEGGHQVQQGSSSDEHLAAGDGS